MLTTDRWQQEAKKTAHWRKWIKYKEAIRAYRRKS